MSAAVCVQDTVFLKFALFVIHSPGITPVVVEVSIEVYVHFTDGSVVVHVDLMGRSKSRISG